LTVQVSNNCDFDANVRIKNDTDHQEYDMMMSQSVNGSSRQRSSMRYAMLDPSTLSIYFDADADDADAED